MVKILINIDFEDSDVDELKLVAELLTRLAKLREKRIQLAKKAILDADVPD